MIRHKDYLLVTIGEGGIKPTVFLFDHGKGIKYWHIGWQYPEDHKYSSGGTCLHFARFGGRKKYPAKLEMVGLASELTPSFLESIEFGDIAFTNGLQFSTTVILKLIQP